MSYWIILKRRNVSLNCTLHIPGRDQSRRQFDGSIDEVRLESDGVAVVVESLFKLATLLMDVAQVVVSLGEEGVLFDGQSAEVGGFLVFSVLEMYGREQEEDSCVGRVLPQELHAVFLGVVVVAGLVL